MSASAQIYICVDKNGRKHYSDKRCTSVNQNVSGTTTKSGKRELPDHIKAYTAAISVIKQSFTLLSRREPSNREYSYLYQLVMNAERRHLMFLSNPVERRIPSYRPFSDINHTRIISSLSDACRVKNVFSVCSTIEGNPWISEEEEIYLQLTNTPNRTDKSSCDNATQAHTGGVISDKMLVYFCQKQT